MHILHVITGLGRGGAEIMLSKLVRWPGRHRHTVISLSSMENAGPGEMGREIAEAGIEVHSLGVSRWRAIPGLLRLVRFVGQDRYDAIQGWMGHGNLAAATAHILAKASAPLLWNVRQTISAGDHDSWLTRKVIEANAWISHRPRLILYNSLAGATQHEAIGYAPEKRRVVPNGFDLQGFRPSAEERRWVRSALGVEEDELLIGLVARFDPWKNHEAFFEGASRLLASGIPARFLFAGTGMEASNRDLLRLMKDSRLIERSLLLGRRDDMPALNAALDIACNVSYGEGFPNAVGEAMASAVPCLVTDVGDCRQIVGDTGVVCAGTDAAAIAHGLAELAGLGWSNRNELGRRARRRIETNFSLRTVVARYDDIYDEVARRAPERTV